MSESQEIPQPQEAQVDQWKHFDALQESFTPERMSIVDTLKQKKWFQQTDEALQVRLATLPQSGRENHDGFLEDLAARPEKMGGVTVQRLEDLAAGNFALIPKFAVQNEQGNDFTYEYVSWRYGPESGAKGIVFVKGADGKLSHFVLLRGDKFSTGKQEWDSVGGFADLKTGDPADEQVTAMLDRIKTEVQEELGVDDIAVDEVYDLGKVNPDAGMTNNQPDLFAAVIDGADAKKIKEGESADNPDVHELRAGGIVIPIEQLPEIVKNNNDAYFLSALSRALAYGIVDFPAVDAQPIPYRADKNAPEELLDAA